MSIELTEIKEGGTVGESLFDVICELACYLNEREKYCAIYLNNILMCYDKVEDVYSVLSVKFMENLVIKYDYSKENNYRFYVEFTETF